MRKNKTWASLSSLQSILISFLFLFIFNTVASGDDYQEANERIELAIKQEASFLDLSRLSISTIPEQATKSKEIKKLNLALSPVSNLVPFRNNTLSELYVDFTGISNVADILMFKDSLRTLGLSGMKIQNEGLLSEFSRLSTIYLSSSELTSLSFLKETNIKTIFLYGTTFRDMATVDYTENQLADDLRNSNISHITSDVVLFQDLSIFDSNENIIQLKLGRHARQDELTSHSYKSQHAISNLRNIRHLEFQDLTIGTEGLEEIAKLDKLRFLEVQLDPNISTLPQFNTPFISHLHIFGESIFSVEQLPNLPNLSTLDLRDTNISNVDGIEKYGKLRKLILGKNKFGRYPLSNSNLKYIVEKDITLSL